MLHHDKPKGSMACELPINDYSQTNFKLGYFINDHYSIALGADHMKYVVTQDQTANITELSEVHL
jgi:hypothetical protein